MAQTDKWRKAKSLFSTTLSSGIGTGTGDTITPNSVSGLPTDTEITLTFDRIDSQGNETPSSMERITGTISGGNLISYTRAVDGSTEQAHSAGAVIEYIWNADDWNDAIDSFLQEHTQAGAHTAASTSADGTIEIATAAETTTGTDATRAVSPDGLAGSDYGKRVVSIIVFDDATDVATGDGAGDVFYRVPAVLNGYNLVAVAAQVQTAGTTGNTDIMIYNVTDSQDMLSTAMRIETGETDTSTSAQPGTINTSYDDVATGDSLRIDVDAVQTTAPKGLLCELTFQLP